MKFKLEMVENTINLMASFEIENIYPFFKTLIMRSGIDHRFSLCSPETQAKVVREHEADPSDL